MSLLSIDVTSPIWALHASTRSLVPRVQLPLSRCRHQSRAVPAHSTRRYTKKVDAGCSLSPSSVATFKLGSMRSTTWYGVNCPFPANRQADAAYYVTVTLPSPRWRNRQFRVVVLAVHGSKLNCESGKTVSRNDSDVSCRVERPYCAGLL